MNEWLYSLLGGIAGALLTSFLHWWRGRKQRAALKTAYEALREAKRLRIEKAQQEARRQLNQSRLEIERDLGNATYSQNLLNFLRDISGPYDSDEGEGGEHSTDP